MKNLVIVVVVLAVVLGILFWQFGSKISQFAGNQNNENQEVSLIWWGLFDEETVVRPLIEAYEKENPKVKIQYVKQNELNYRTRVQTQIRAGQGPDVFTFNSSWAPEFIYDLVPAPQAIMTAADFEKTYYPFVKDSLVYGTSVLGLPQDLNGLALFYNEDILKAANVKPPKNWQEFLDSSRKMTVKNTAGQIQTSGAALGTTTNIDYWQDIISFLFFQQVDADLASPANKGGVDVLRFYTSFVTDPQNKTWDTNLPSAFEMFSRGKLAYYFADSGQANEIIAANPELKFKTAPVPQFPEKEANFGTSMVLGVANKPNALEAWKFVKYLSSPQSSQIFYQQQTQNQAVGSIFPRRDMAELLTNDPILGAFVKEAPTMKSWYLQSKAKDNGLVDEINSLYKTAIDQTLAGDDPLTSLEAISPKITEAVNKYTKPVAPTVKK
jgi:multiple sugar transport system substrate-binding protein